MSNQLAYKSKFKISLVWLRLVGDRSFFFFFFIHPQILTSTEFFVPWLYKEYSIPRWINSLQLIPTIWNPLASPVFPVSLNISILFGSLLLEWFYRLFPWPFSYCVLIHRSLRKRCKNIPCRERPGEEQKSGFYA